MKKILVSWSSGKDSAWMLHVLRQCPDVQIMGLLTTVNEESERVVIHDIRSDLLQAQASSCDLPLWHVRLPCPCHDEDYERAMRAAIYQMQGEGITGIAFGDLFLEGIREYRVSRMSGTGIAPLFPLWHQPTHDLARQMISEGLRAKIVSVDPRKLDVSFLGREFNLSLLQDLPESVDPCGENGEFHTFAYSGPMFSSSIHVRTGETVEREGFLYNDLFLV